MTADSRAGRLFAYDDDDAPIEICPDCLEPLDTQTHKGDHDNDRMD